MRPITEIIVHCTATRPDWWAGKSPVQRVAEVRRWHVTPKPEGRGFKNIGYHYLIDRNGVIVPGRPLDQNGAHVIERNIGTIGVALFGGHGSAADDAFAENFTPEQDASLRKLIADLTTRFGPLKISGHSEYAAKACPGFSVRDWLKPAPPDVAAPDAAPSAPPSGGFFMRLLRALFGGSHG